MSEYNGMRCSWAFLTGDLSKLWLNTGSQNNIIAGQMPDLLSQCLQFANLNRISKIDVGPVDIDLPISHNGDQNSSFIRKSNAYDNNYLEKNLMAETRIQRHTSDAVNIPVRFSVEDDMLARNANSEINHWTKNPEDVKQDNSMTASGGSPENQKNNFILNQRIVVPSLFKNPSLVPRRSELTDVFEVKSTHLTEQQPSGRSYPSSRSEGGKNATLSRRRRNNLDINWPRKFNPLYNQNDTIHSSNSLESVNAPTPLFKQFLSPAQVQN